MYSILAVDNFSAKLRNYSQISIHNSQIFVIFATKTVRRMKVIGTIKTYILRVWRSVYFKYAVVTIVGVLLVGFLDDNSLWSHIKNLQQIRELNEEKERYEGEFRRDQAQIKELDRNPKAIEKIARERYFMKADDEDIFVLSDDERNLNPIASHEAAQ